VSDQPDVAEVRLAEGQGPLRTMTVGGVTGLVGRVNGAEHLPAPAAVALRTQGHLITVFGGDDTTTVEQLFALAASVEPIDEASWTAATTNLGPRPPEPCDLVPPPSRNIVRVPAGSAGDVTFYRARTGADPKSAVICEIEPSQHAGGQLADAARGSVLGVGIGPGAYIDGLVDADVASVRVELQNGTDVTVPTYRVPGYTGRVWVAANDTLPRYRAIEFIDAVGKVLRRMGRPPR
jgi:hypothetical protein